PGASDTPAEPAGDGDHREDVALRDLLLGAANAHRAQRERVVSRVQVLNERLRERTAVTVDQRSRGSASGEPEQTDEYEERDRLEDDERHEDARAAELLELEAGRGADGTQGLSHVRPR